MKHNISKIFSYLERYFSVLFYPKYLVIGKFRFRLRFSGLSTGMKWFLFHNTNTYEFGERTLSAEILQPGDKVLEAGTSIGILSGIISNTIGNLGQLITLEGDPKLHKIAKSINVQNNNIIFINGVLNFEKVEHEDFIPEGWLGGRISSGKKAIKVKAYDIISLCESYNPNVLILDIEGGEEGFLNTSIPYCIRNIIIELHPHVYGLEKLKAIENHFTANGFKFINKIEMVYSFQRA